MVPPKEIAPKIRGKGEHNALFILQLHGEQGHRFPLGGRRPHHPPPPRVHGFTTYETIEVQPILVVKNDGTRQAFDVSKIKRGIIKACEKRPVPIEKIDALADDVAKRLYNSMVQEVSSKQIGEMVMEGLKELDEVAYVRYASVYRSFKDISSFMRELQQMMEYKAEEEQKGEKRAEKI